jgi:hypothetical protein
VIFRSPFKCLGGFYLNFVQRKISMCRFVDFKRKAVPKF